jgi:hypothetical protein
MTVVSSRTGLHIISVGDTLLSVVEAVILCCNFQAMPDVDTDTIHLDFQETRHGRITLGSLTLNGKALQ